jgi:hypothetical protein
LEQLKQNPGSINSNGDIRFIQQSWMQQKMK